MMTKKDDFIDFKTIFKIVAKVLSWTAFLMLLIIGIFLLYYVISAQIYGAKGEEYSPTFSLYTIVSGSMEPKIQVYDVILNVNIKDKSKLKKGDVVTYVSTNPLTNGMIITHRIIDVVEKNDELFFRTKGDNSKSPDTGLQSENSILGKTIMKIPMLGRVQFFLASRGGWIVAILIPALGVIIYDILKIFKLVGVKDKLDKVTKEEDEIVDEKVVKKGKAIKELLKRKHVPKDSLPKLKKTKDEEKLCEPEYSIEIEDLTIENKPKVEIDSLEIDDNKDNYEEELEKYVEEDLNPELEITRVLDILDEMDSELEKKDKSDFE